MSQCLLLSTTILLSQNWGPQWDIHHGKGEVVAAPAKVQLVGPEKGRSTTHPRAIASLPTSMGSKWQLGISITYRRLGESGGRVALQLGEERLIWTGADSVYNKMSTFHGAEMVDTRVPEIGRAYRFEFRRDNDQFSTWLDGKMLGRSRATKNPTTLFVGSDDSIAEGTDTDLDVDRISLTMAPASSIRTPTAHSGSVEGIDRMRLVLGVDPLLPPPATPLGDRLRISAKESQVLAAPGALLELAPIMDLPDFKPAEVALFADEKLVRRARVVGKTMPVFSYETPTQTRQSVRLRVRSAGEDRRQIDLMKVDLQASSEQVTAPKLVVEADKVRLTEFSGQKLFLFLGDSYLGCVRQPQAFSLDTRRLRPGQYELRLVTTNQEGILLSPVRVPVDVRPRYALSTDHDLGVLNLEGRVDGTNLHVRQEAEASAARSRVYVRGALVAVNDGREFTCRLPMGDVPSGQIEVQVVGVGEDGVLFPPESLILQVKNPIWDALRVRSAKAQRLEALKESLSEDDVKVAYWYRRATSEPAFRSYAFSRKVLTVDEFGQMASIQYVSSFTFPGDAGKYLAECSAAIARRAHTRLQIGRLQRELGLSLQARHTFERCIEEAEPGSATAHAANAELRQFRHKNDNF